MDGLTGRLPRTLGRSEIIACSKCKKRYQVTYNGTGENDTYDHKCDNCGNTLFTESNGEGYTVKEEQD